MNSNPFEDYDDIDPYEWQGDDYDEYYGHEIDDGREMHPDEFDDYPYDDDDFIYADDRSEFADPHGESALRAETPNNPRNLPCGNCGRPNMLTPADKRRGYQCDICANEQERGF